MDNRTGKPIGNIVAAQPWTCSETRSETMDDLPPRQKATRGHRQAVAEIGLRFQPSNAADLEAHRMRLELLAIDCSEITPTLLRHAGDRVAQYSQFLPKASEILAAAREIVEERQRVQRNSGIATNSDGEIIEHRADVEIGHPCENVERCKERNRQLMRDGANYRVFPVGRFNMGKVQVDDDGAIAPTHICNRDGTFRNRHQDSGEVSGLWPRQ